MITQVPDPFPDLYAASFFFSVVKLPGTLEQVIAKAIRRSGTYKVRPDKSIRVFGGVNVVLCGDFWQLHPVTGT